MRLITSFQTTLRQGLPWEDPLSGIVGIGFREAVGVLIGSDLLPVIEVEGNFDEGGISDFQRLIQHSQELTVAT